jgi:hypothetical protein
MELYRGVRNKEALGQIKRLIEGWPVIQVDAAISETAIRIAHDYWLSHNCRVADALIAATALLSGYELFTYNVKGFRYIPGIKLYDFA